MPRVVLSWVQPVCDLACAYLHIYESDEEPQPIEDTERHGWVLRGSRDDPSGDPACFRIQFPPYAGEAERKAALAQAHDVSVRVGVDLEILGEPPPLSLEQGLQPCQVQRFAREGDRLFALLSWRAARTASGR